MIRVTIRVVTYYCTVVVVERIDWVVVDRVNWVVDRGDWIVFHRVDRVDKGDCIALIVLIELVELTIL